MPSFREPHASTAGKWVSLMVALLVYLAMAAGVAAVEPAAAAVPPPLLKVTYGPVPEPSPLIYSYAVWPDGRILYQSAPRDADGPIAPVTKNLQVTPQVAARVVNELLQAGFHSLQPEVARRAAVAKDGAVSLEQIIATYAQKVTVEFHFANSDFKTEIDAIDTLPWAGPVLRKIEKDLGITRLVERNNLK
jgi:hypothetical protein